MFQKERMEWQLLVRFEEVGHNNAHVPDWVRRIRGADADAKTVGGSRGLPAGFRRPSAALAPASGCFRQTSGGNLASINVTTDG